MSTISFAVKISPKVKIDLKAYCRRNGMKIGFFVESAIEEKIGKELGAGAVAIARRATRQGAVERLPEFLHQYFWDTDPQVVDLKTNARYVIERILEYGQKDAVLWMEKRYSKRLISHVVQVSRALSPRSANYWAIKYGIDKGSVLCLQKAFTETRKMP